MTVTLPVKIEVFQLLLTISESLNLVSKQLMNHHRQVAHISSAIGEEMGLGHKQIVDLALAGAVHDIGGLSLCARKDILDFELASPELHTLPGYLLLKTFQPFSGLAKIVRYHHQYWLEGRGEECEGRPVPRESHILHLADRIAIQIDKDREVLAQVSEIVRRIRKNSGYMFVPEQVEAFEELAGRESFWLDLVSPSVCQYMESKYHLGAITMDSEGLTELTAMLSRLIDFRSNFTATHSSGVAAVAEALATGCSLSVTDCFTVKIAGYLHDMGKLVVPAELLEKKTKLTPADFELIRKHPYYSYRILQSIQGMEEIAEWTAYHHERLDGTGYPFHIPEEKLALGARILGVADTFTALAENRPYRTSMSRRSIFQILQQLAKRGKVDQDLVNLLYEDYERINQQRFHTQQKAQNSHKKFMAGIGSSPCPDLSTTTL